jgi:hypothetical protein
LDWRILNNPSFAISVVGRVLGILWVDEFSSSTPFATNYTAYGHFQSDAKNDWELHKFVSHLYTVFHTIEADIQKI